jgi:hypothetical protein
MPIEGENGMKMVLKCRMFERLFYFLLPKVKAAMIVESDIDQRWDSTLDESGRWIKLPSETQSDEGLLANDLEAFDDWNFYSENVALEIVNTPRGCGWNVRVGTHTTVAGSGLKARCR